MYLSPAAVFLFFAFGHIDRLHRDQSAGHGMRLNRQLACLQFAVRRSVRSREFQGELIGFELEVSEQVGSPGLEVAKSRN